LRCELHRPHRGAAGSARARRTRGAARRADQAAIRGRQGARRQRRGGARSRAPSRGVRARPRLACRPARLAGHRPHRKPDPRARGQCRISDRSRARQRMRRKRAAAEEAILTISSVGARGEGRAAELVEVLEKGARAPPPCPHFGRCGGCALQHLAAAAYVEAKEAQVRAALRQHALGSVVAEPLIRIPPGTRRRARFAVERPRGGGPAVVGFNARASHRIVDLDSCLVLDPALVRLAEALRAAAGTLWPKGAKGAATATVAETGIELLLDLADAPDLAGLEALAAFAAEQDLDRLAWRAPGVSEPVPAAIKRKPFVLLSGVAVELPPDAFLQASAE